MPEHATRPDLPLRVVLFSGGRGSGALTRRSCAMPGVALTLAINGYDDGASTGEVRRFLGDALGPSDFRKNASRLAAALRDLPSVARPPARPPAARGDDCRAGHRVAADCLPKARSEVELAPSPPAWPACRGAVARVPRPVLAHSGSPVRLRRLRVGNLVFAGAYLRAGRGFNAAVDDYCGAARPAAGRDRERDRRHATRFSSRIDRGRPGARQRG